MLIKLAWRNLFRRKRRTAITVVSIAFGVALCLFFTGLSDGMYGTVIEMAVTMGSGHLVVENPAYRDDQDLEHTVRVNDALVGLVEAIGEVRGVSLRVSGPAIISTSHGTVGGGFDAVDPGRDRAFSMLSERIVDGRYLAGPKDVLIGDELARKLQAKPGSKVVVTTQDAHGETVQELFKVAGIFSTRTDMADGFYFQITLERARQMLGLEDDAVTQLGIYLTDQRAMGRVRAQVEASPEVAAAGAVVVPWQEVLKDLANYMEVDVAFNWIFQLLLFMVILAGVLNTVLMSVMERTYELGVMLSIGMRRLEVMLMVVLECAMLGVLGTATGAAFGWLENLILYHHPIDLSSSLPETSVGGFYLDMSLRMDLAIDHFVVTLAVVFVLVLAAGLYPAWKAGAVEPVEALQTV